MHASMTEDGVSSLGAEDSIATDTNTANNEDTTGKSYGISKTAISGPTQDSGNVTNMQNSKSMFRLKHMF